MTTAIVLPDHKFPIHIPLYDFPDIANNRVFAVYGNSLKESLVNHSGRAPSVGVGVINVEDLGIRQGGTEDYIRNADLGEMSGAGFTLLVAFRSPKTGFSSGLANLWSQTDKNIDTLRRRIFTDGSAGGTGPLRLNSYPSPSGDGSNWVIQPDTPYLVSMIRSGNGVIGYLRLHAADGSTLTGNTLPAQPNPITYAPGTVLEVGNGSNANSGGSLVQGVGLWSGVLSADNLKKAAASLALATGLFE